MNYFLFVVLIAWGIAGVFAFLEYEEQPQPRNMPTTDEVRQIMLDCEQYSPGKRCIFVAMTVPDFSESLKQ